MVQNANVSNKVTEEQETLAVTFLTECMEGETLLDAYKAAYDQSCKARAYLSAAESTIQCASGTRAPMVCWGCGEPHMWASCPKKHDPTTQRKVNDLLKEKFGECQKQAEK